MENKFAQVIISLSAKQLNRPFTYKIPDELKYVITKGMRVVVPFGNGNKKYEGYVVEIMAEANTDVEISKIKSILSVMDKDEMFNKDLLALAHWMSDKYFTNYADCLKCIMPTGISYKSSFIYEVIGENENLSKKQEELYEFILKSSKFISHDELLKQFGKNIGSTITALMEKGAISRTEESTAKDFVQNVRFMKLNWEYIEDIKKAIEKESKQSQVLKFLLENDEVSVKFLMELLKITNSPIKTLADKHYILVYEKEIRRDTAHTLYKEEEKSIQWTSEQIEVIESIKKDINDEAGEKRPVLINGVTGSGKTEVYLSLIEEVIQKGKQAIVLVPEISLTPQTVNRFMKRFPSIVSVTHSKMSMGERFDQWKNAKEGKISVMIGPRSAIFTPFSNLGIIIIDEEHEHTYKSETAPKYDAKEVACKRAELTGAVVVLGSATPSVESYYKTQMGEYKIQHMENRVNSQMPKVEIVDMRNELKLGNRSIFSGLLFEEMQHNIDNDEQIILFLNRRGHSTFVSCRECGYVVKCDDCNINYTYHLYTNKLICHYCARETENPENCPQCGSKYIKYFGVGTQRIEDEIKSLFPHVPVLRMDLDTTGKKNSHSNILADFRKGNAKILIGTQMIAKGLDFPNVTLVGVVAADVSLNAGDYRSGENTYQLLTQVSGRAGRRNKLGRAIIQTYNPEHYAVNFAKDGNYDAFFDHEIALRRQMNYPPFTHIFTVLFTGDNEKKVIESLFKLSDIMQYCNKTGDFEVLGPAPCHISKINNKYRWKIIVKAVDETRLKNFSLYCVEKLKALGDMSSINVNLTLDPLSNI